MRKILKYMTHETQLRKPSREVTSSDGALLALCKDLRRANAQARGLGVAAPQIGVTKRVFYYNVEGNEGFMFNPEILETSAVDIAVEEGCLSIPGYFWEIERPESVSVQWQDHEGGHIKSFDGMMARLIQHEVDHLNGDLIVDMITEEQYDEFERKFFGV